MTEPSAPVPDTARPPAEQASDRTTPARMPERVSSDRAALDQLLDSSLIGHVGFVTEDGQPYVLPTAIARDGADVLLHGSTGSRWLRLIGQGIPVSLAVTELDALVVARSAFESSMRYRSAVLFGRCQPLAGPAKQAALDLLTDALIPGRVAEVRRPTGKELAATLVLRLQVEEFTIKLAQGWPDDPPSDVAESAWAGVLPRRLSYPQAWPAPDLREGIELPGSVRRLLAGPAD
ncbi:MAG TPA: pyridoxamine 5'-phosphate oxidase family protein [Jatrophihabitans sp.]|nr:pyridoxamine 5'-phosphate oxidase family protein [Jatrophihabitans sp.]